MVDRVRDWSEDRRNECVVNLEREGDGWIGERVWRDNE